MKSDENLSGKNRQSYVDDLREQLRRLSEICEKNNNCDLAIFSEMSQRLDELLRAGRTKEIANMIKENILGVLIIGAGPVLQYTNGRAREIWGSDALIKTELTSDTEVFFLADQVTHCRNHLPWLRALHGQNVDSDLIFMQPKTGSGDKWLRVCALPQRSRNDDAIVAAIVLMIDVTEQVQNEHRLRQIKQALTESIAAASIEHRIQSDSNADEEPVGKTVGSDSKVEKLALVADDLKVNQILLTSQLKQMGFTVHLANNGKEAVAEASEHKYDLILMDCDMPIMDGYAATRAIRAAEKQDYPQDDGKKKTQALILSLTEHNRETDREKCLAAGADEYLAKSSDKTLLKNIIERLLKEGGPDADQPSDSSSATSTSAPASNSENKPALFDMKALEQIYGSEGLGEILDVFVSSAQSLIDCIQNSLSQRDVRGTHHFACCLKGSCSLLAAGTMAKLCGEIAESVIRGKWFDADEYFAELTSAFRSLRKSFPAGTGSSGLFAINEEKAKTQKLSLDVLEQKVGRSSAEAMALTFLTESKALLSAISKGIKKYDNEGVLRDARDLSAICSSFLLAKDLRSLTKDLETACDEQHVDWIEVAALYDRMSRSYNEVEAHVAEYLLSKTMAK